ncbi:hypothetical protein EMPG_12849 [Blastomyces silverae]|uniref:Uncharacterized protein n=1 Tax=Blastomyces silverae TaxID=2060906 RepID=A0A0H1BKG2_9EURO|nr:hypothetical protein EMPG_12849 [Blastomyces silverae]
MENQNLCQTPSAPSKQVREQDMGEPTITMGPSPEQPPLLDQDTNVNLNQLLVDTFDKVGKASGAGGLDTSKWAVKDGENLSRHRHRSNPGQYHHRHHHHQQQLVLPQQNQLSISGPQRTGTSHTIPQDCQPGKFYSPQHDENVYSGSQAGVLRGDNLRTGQTSSTSFEATTPTREGDATRIISIRDVDMDVDMSSLRALVGQCIDPGLERIVDVWEAGDTCRTLTLHFTTASKAIMFSSLLGRLHSWSKYKVEYAPSSNL